MDSEQIRLAARAGPNHHLGDRNRIGRVYVIDIALPVSFLEFVLVEVGDAAVAEPPPAALNLRAVARAAVVVGVVRRERVAHIDREAIPYTQTKITAHFNTVCRRPDSNRRC